MHRQRFRKQSPRLGHKLGVPRGFGRLRGGHRQRDNCGTQGQGPGSSDNFLHDRHPRPLLHEGLSCLPCAGWLSWDVPGPRLSEHILAPTGVPCAHGPGVGSTEEPSGETRVSEWTPTVETGEGWWQMLFPRVMLRDLETQGQARGSCSLPWEPRHAIRVHLRPLPAVLSRDRRAGPLEERRGPLPRCLLHGPRGTIPPLPRDASFHLSPSCPTERVQDIGFLFPLGLHVSHQQLDRLPVLSGVASVSATRGDWGPRVGVGMLLAPNSRRADMSVAVTRASDTVLTDTR